MQIFTQSLKLFYYVRITLFQNEWIKNVILLLLLAAGYFLGVLTALSSLNWTSSENLRRTRLLEHHYFPLLATG